MGLMLRLDSWLNEVTGLGIPGLDKAVHAYHRRSQRKQDQYWEDLYHDDAFARRVCEKVPDEMTRAGFELSMGDEENAHDIATKLLDSLRDLAAVTHLKDGMTWERVYGGGAVFIAADDGQTDPALPLDETKLRKISHLATVDKHRLFARTWYPGNHPKAGMPETYWLQRLDGDREAGQIAVHESRLLIFPGGRVTHQRRLELYGWGHCTLESVHEILADYNMSWRGLTHMLQSANQEVWAFKGFLNAVRGGGDAIKEYFASRLRMSVMSSGPNRPLILDSDGERYERHASEFQGVPETIREMCQRVAAACDMPMTILFGMSPAGLNATGESDLQWWYETIAAKQVERLEPRLRRLLTLLMLSKEGPTKGKLVEDWEIKFRPLKQLTQLEVATLRKTVAETDELYVHMQALLPEEVTLSRWRPEGWSMDTKVDLDARKKILEAELERAIEQAENPPEPPPQLPGAPPAGPNAPPPPSAPGQPPASDPRLKQDTFDPSQPRDDDGKWSGSGGGGSGGGGGNSGGGGGGPSSGKQAGAGKPTWSKSSEGYTLNAPGHAYDGAKLVKSGKTWLLKVSGKELQLGKKASFDEAERLLAEHA